MIIEIKDLPNGQTIDKIDIHIDFQKGSITTNVPITPIVPSTTPVEWPLTCSTNSPEVPNEMVNTEF